MAETIGIGLVGYGAIGRLHALCIRMLPLIYPELPPIRIVAVQTATDASAERARWELGEILATTALSELLAHPHIQVIDCCAPTGDHARVAIESLAAGKALFCEKPLAATEEQAAEIVEMAAVRGLPGGVNFHFRQVPALQEARRRCEAGLLGEAVGFTLRYFRSSNLRRDRPLTWRFRGPGSGVLVDLGSHLIDLALHLLGPIASVGARTRTVIAERSGPGGQPVTIDSDDVAWLQCELASGAIGTIAVSKLVPGAGDDLRIEAYGTGGAFIFDSRDPNGLLINDGSGERRIATLSQTQPPASLPSGETPTGVLAWHAASIRTFLSAYAEGRQPAPDLRDGLAVDRVIAAALRSAAGGGAAESL